MRIVPIFARIIEPKSDTEIRVSVQEQEGWVLNKLETVPSDRRTK